MSTSPNTLQWRKLGAVVAVQTTITLGWVFYALYLPELLVELGFQEQLAQTLLLVERALSILIEPIFGHLSDRSQSDIGSRLPWITLGIALAATFFIVLPLINLFVPTGSPLRWLFPVLAVAWALAMAIFRAPVIALLRQVAPQPQLVIAASFLTISQQVIRSFSLIAQGWILSWGPLVTFGIGSVVLLGAGIFLKRVVPPTTPALSTQPRPSMSLWSVVVIAGVGISIGLGVRFLFITLGQAFTAHLGEGNWGLFGFNLLVALVAAPMGVSASRLRGDRGLLAGLVICAVGLGAIAGVGVIVPLLVLVLAIALALGLVFNGMVPFVLGLVSERRSGLGMGLFFGAMGGANVVYGLALAGVQGIMGNAIAAVFSLMVAGGLVWFCGRKQERFGPN